MAFKMIEDCVLVYDTRRDHQKVLLVKESAVVRVYYLTGHARPLEIGIWNPRDGLSSELQGVDMPTRTEIAACAVRLFTSHSVPL